MDRKYYRINYNIRAANLRVLDSEGKQIGVLTINDALTKAKESGEDLVEIAPTANPPVAKIIDFKKFLYLEEKKEKKAKKNVKGGEIKEVRFTPFIAQGDLDFRFRKAQGYLEDGNKVRVVVKFVGRQLSKKDFGYVIIKKVKDALSFCSEFENEPRWFGPNLTVTLTPIKKTDSNEKNKTENPKIDINPVPSN